MFGDSLTDLVDFYGARYLRDFESGYENSSYSGYFMSSFDDYFRFYAFPNGVSVQNLGISMATSTALMDRTSGNDETRCHPIGYSVNNNFSNIDPHPTADNGSSSRSLVMIGGNDVLYSASSSGPFPFLKRHVVGLAVENLQHFIDWNLENGKSVILEGTFPINSLGIKHYDSFIINREALCKGPEASLPKLEPWWLILIPGVQNMLMQYIQYYLDQWVHFTGDTYHELAHGYLINSSITQACLNDKIVNELVPSYRAIYGNRVQVQPLYDLFNETGSGNYQKNFWVPVEKSYWKYVHGFRPTAGPLSGTGPNDPYVRRKWDDVPFSDPIHIGPVGYRMRATALAPILAANGWNQPDPGGSPAVDGQAIFDLNEYIIKKKNEMHSPMYSFAPGYSATSKSGATGRCEHFNHPQNWPFPDIHYTICVKAPAPGDTAKPVAYETHDAIRGYWLNQGGPSWFGFPVVDVYATGFLDIDRRQEFECGYIYWSPIHGIRNVVPNGSCP